MRPWCCPSTAQHSSADRLRPSGRRLTLPTLPIPCAGFTDEGRWPLGNMCSPPTASKFFAQREL